MSQLFRRWMIDRLVQRCPRSKEIYSVRWFCFQRMLAVLLMGLLIFLAMGGAVAFWVALIGFFIG